jgi:hypothetical protein
MSYEYREYPEFSWSISRQRKLDQCPRAYFYQYYLHWNGWLHDAPAEARVAYRLGKLTSLDALLGQQVDVRARELEAAARAGEDPPGADELEARTREALRRLWACSQNGRAAFEARPGKVTMLRSHYLGQDTRPETDRLNEKAGPGMQGLLATSHWRRLRGRGDEGRVAVPAFAHFQWDGVKVYAAPDLAYVSDGALHVVDWKTGGADDTQPVQVLLQMWWALEAHPELAAAAAEGGTQVRGCLEYVVAGVTQPVEPPAPAVSPDRDAACATLDDFREACAGTVREGVAQMRALLADPERNAPLPKQAFERRESGLCHTCCFQAVCA